MGDTVVNRIHNRLSDLLASKGPPPWSERLILTDEVQAVLICQGPGETSRRGYSPNFDEFWVVLGGEMVFEIEGQESFHATTGDVVFGPKGKANFIRIVGDGPALRLGIISPKVVFFDPETRRPFG